MQIRIFPDFGRYSFMVGKCSFIIHKKNTITDEKHKKA